MVFFSHFMFTWLSSVSIFAIFFAAKYFSRYSPVISNYTWSCSIFQKKKWATYGFSCSVRRCFSSYAHNLASLDKQFRLFLVYFCAFKNADYKFGVIISSPMGPKKVSRKLSAFQRRRQGTRFSWRKELFKKYQSGIRMLKLSACTGNRYGHKFNSGEKENNKCV